MAVHQTRSIIDQTREFHSRASRYYHRLADSAQRQRVKLLLDYMSEHEKRLANCLATYEDSAPRNILDTWLQSAGTTDPAKLLEDEPLVSEATVDQLINMGLRLSKCVIQVYQDLSMQAEPDSVRQVFANLLNLEEKALQQFIRDAGRMSDL